MDKVQTHKKVQEIEAPLCKEESDESLIDLDSRQDMGIIHKDFSLQISKHPRESPEKVRLVNNENKRNQTKLVDILERQGSMRTTLKFHEVDEDTIDIDKEVKQAGFELCQALLKLIENWLS